MTAPRRLLAALAAVVTTATLVLLPAGAAGADSQTGWLRLGQLSPDTEAVDVTLTNLAGGTVLYKLSKVAYGDVSPYMKLAAGTYTLSMVPAGTPATSTPVLTGAISVAPGEAATMVAMGLNKHLTTKLYRDDLATPAGSRAKVRILQASVRHPTVTVRFGSRTIAGAARFGTVSGYTTVKAGTSPLTISAGSADASASVSLKAGTVHTLVVLDDAQGDLRVTPLVDSASVTVPPVGGVATGGGALAAADGSALALAAPAAGLAAAAGGVLVVALLRRRPAARG